jgi:hypothetical protein
MHTVLHPGRLLEDEPYELLLDPSQASDIAGGFLQRRCFVSAATPDGFEVLGAFTMASDGTWEARITRAPDTREGNGYTVVARRVERAEAIVALWRARFDAYIGYHRL